MRTSAADGSDPVPPGAHGSPPTVADVDSAVKVPGDGTLRTIARELVDTVRRNVTIDWSVKETVRAKMRTMVRRILRKYGYPPDKQEKATQTVLEQAELLCREEGL
jgi:type I restriction enzyme, R subunit